ncbi:NAD(P)-binding protein [Rhizophagus irregularis]|uniref:NAD(P)-binding protein n=1 Tax=Rhizophagus irregularis TaxID=588596 RepID=A0A2N0RNI3_9GLOM|nr:NAD(P)-binding protein [Rhizophagus irregularis]
MVSEKRVILITGGNGFIGSHVAKRLHDQGYYVRVIDLHDDPTFRLYKDTSEFCSEFIEGDIRSIETCRKLFNKNDVKWVFHFAANMGGVGVINSKNNFVIYQENHIMSLNILQVSMQSNIEKFFYASSACVYPYNKQINLNEDIKLKEDDSTWNCNSIDTKPQESYGAEKLNTEIFISSLRELSTSSENKTTSKFPQFKIARFHNVYGEGGTWYGGREKAPAALLRKAICASKYTKENVIEIWGNGKQRRSFLYIADCVDAIIKFMKSDLDLTLNIGSEESIRIDELACVAFETVGVTRDKVTLKFDESKPIGVNNRNSDNTLVSKYLDWYPKHTIREGMEKTSLWIQQELEKQRHQYKDDSWNELVRTYLESKVDVLNYNNETITFGVLLPITSRGLTKPEDCLENLSNFAKSLYETSQEDIQDRFGETRYQIKIYVGIDNDDSLFHPIKNNPAERILNEHGFTDIHTMEFDFPPGSICEIWIELARKAYDDNCDYFILFGDDVIIETNGWMNKFHEAYRKISIQKKVPRGFGCITFTDTSFHGFPTFPVIGRVHLDIFNGEVLPRKTFKNQDGDPYLFQTYRRWGCSMMLEDVEIQNVVGGSLDPRYERTHHPNWSFDILNNSVNRVEEWLKKNCKNPIPKLLTLDVIVPSYRVNLKYLDPMISLKKPVTMSTTTIIIVDDPNSSNIITLKKFYEKDPFIRIRVNKTNLGASLSRNRGLRESNADYVLFFDDDVVPEKNILFECEKIIKKHPNACGFIGNTKFPPADGSIYTSALALSGLTFFWGISELWDDDVPWGVTANLLIRRFNENILYDPVFPKTGGGEDIDFCLKQRNFFIKNTKNGKGFQAAPNVMATHPWWNNGNRDYWRFYKWATGDGALVKMYPELTYNDIVPNSIELLFGTILFFLVSMIFSLFFAVFYNTPIINTFTILTFLSIPLVIVSSIIADMYLHLTEQPYKHTSTVGGYRYILAMVESSLIRIMSEFGRLMGMIERNEWGYIGKRFDWFVKRKEGSVWTERYNNLRKFLIWFVVTESLTEAYMSQPFKKLDIVIIIINMTFFSVLNDYEAQDLLS